MACTVRADGGTDGGATGGGIHPGEETSSLPLRPPGTAAGAHQPGRGNGVAGEYDEWGNLLGEESAQHLQQSPVCRDSSMMRSRGCTTTATGTMIRCRGGISPRPDRAGGGWNLYQYPLNPIEHIDPLGLSLDLNYYSPSDPIYKGSLNVREFPTGFTVGGHGSPTSMSDDRIKKEVI